MDLEKFGLFLLADFLFSFTPGPAVLLVVGLSLRQGYKIGFAGALGTIATNAFYFTLSALGVGALIVSSALLFNFLKWAGAVYLAYLGLVMIARPWRHKKDKATSATTPRQEANALDLKAATEAVGKRKKTFRTAFLKGAVLNLSNPKNIAYFVAILPQFIDLATPLAPQIAILGAASIFLELPILMAYAFTSHRLAQRVEEKAIVWLESCGGGLLIAMGIALALYRKAKS